ncbi:MAG: hypothetical protein OXC83_00955 [Chloroflexi bacterium]|nr:hypothetical protein [Chloroflexota bacterium]
MLTISQVNVGKTIQSTRDDVGMNLLKPYGLRSTGCRRGSYRRVTLFDGRAVRQSSGGGLSIGAGFIHFRAVQKLALPCAILRQILSRQQPAFGDSAPGWTTTQRRADRSRPQDDAQT